MTRSLVNAGPVPDNLLLVGVAGSHAYGLATETSDVDIRGVFAAPTREVLSLHGVTNSVVELEGQDTNFDELQRFLENCLKCNPERLEMLSFARQRLGPSTGVHQQVAFGPATQETLLREPILTSFGFMLLDIQDLFLHRDKIAGAYGGHARKMRKQFSEGRFAAAGKPYHLIRLMLTGTHTLETGKLQAAVKGPSREHLLAVKRGEWPLQEVLAWYDRLQPSFEYALENSVLPNNNDAGVEAANELLLDVRRHYLSW